MLTLVLLYLGPTLLIAAAIGWLGTRPDRSAPPTPLSASPNDGQDLIPGAGFSAGEDGLAVFYAYQLAITRIDRT